MPRSFLVKKMAEDDNNHWHSLPSGSTDCGVLDLSPRSEVVARFTDAGGKSDAIAVLKPDPPNQLTEKKAVDQGSFGGILQILLQNRNTISTKTVNIL